MIETLSALLLLSLIYILHLRGKSNTIPDNLSNYMLETEIEMNRVVEESKSWKRQFLKEYRKNKIPLNAEEVRDLMILAQNHCAENGGNREYELVYFVTRWMESR